MNAHRVTHINSSAGIGGGERHLLLQARYLRGSEFDLDYILPEEGVFCDELEKAGLRYQVVPMRTKFSLRAGARIGAHLRRNRTDLAHLQGARANWYGRKAARNVGVKAIFCTVHNSVWDYPYPAWRRRLYLALERRTTALVDQWIAVSTGIRQDLVRYYGIPESKIEVVLNGIDPDEMDVRQDRKQLRRSLGLGPESLVVLEAARMTGQKGHRYLLDAVAALKDDLPALRCLFAGDGPTRPELMRQAAALGLAGRVHFLGFRSDIPDLLSAADVYVLPSLSEGLPLGLLEAMAMGCPVIASAVKGVTDAIEDRVDGFLVPAADVSSLVAALRQLAASAELRRCLGEAASRKVRAHFTAERMARETATLYRRRLE